jgi:hypothetical protein
MRISEKSANVSGSKVLSDLRRFANRAAEGDRMACLEIARSPGLAMLSVQLREGEPATMLGSLILRKPIPEVAVEVLKNPAVAIIPYGNGWTLGGRAVLGSQAAATYAKKHELDEVEVEKAVTTLGDLPACVDGTGLQHSLIGIAKNPERFRLGGCLRRNQPDVDVSLDQASWYRTVELRGAIG